MTARRTISRLARVRVFDSYGGICHICRFRIQVGQAWDCEHIKPLWLGGEDTETNMAPAHKVCHRTKSADESPQRAKSNRVRAKHLGIKKRSGFRGWRKFDGTPVYARRNTNAE